MFTLTDKTLLDRAARMINERAKALRQKWEMVGWAGTKEGRAAKLEYDRLLRDERDMRALGKRMCLHFDVKAAPRVAKGAPQDTAEVDDPLNPLSPEARADYLSDLGPGSNRDFSGLQFGAEGKPQLQGGTIEGTVEAGNAVQ